MSQDALHNAIPIGEEEFTRLMANCGLSADNKSVAVAVSGGADSMALSLLVARWGKAVYLSFDHKLRAESSAEILQVQKWLTRRGLKHYILSWDGEKPTSNIQQTAREARYLAMEKWCKEHAIEHLLIAHHEADQAETFLMRLARGSGVDGLSAMSHNSAPMFLDDGPQYVRPLLTQSKNRLLVTLEGMGQAWLEDPSNENMVFTRVQARKLLDDEPLGGINPMRLAKTAERMKRVRRVLDRLTSQLLDKAVSSTDLGKLAGYCHLNTKKLVKADEEIALRALSKLLTHFGGSMYPPSMLPVERLLNEIMRDGFSGATLGGCHILAGPSGTSQVLIGREENAVGEEVLVKPGETKLWDNRFVVHIDQNLPPLWVKKLQASQWREILKADKALPKPKITYVPELPNVFVPTVPVFCLANDDALSNIVAIPTFKHWQNEPMGLTANFQPKQALKPKLP